MMNTNHKTTKYFFWLLVLLTSFGLKAQTAATYFGFNQNVNPFGLAMNTSGDIFYVDDWNWPQSIKKVDANGVVSTYVTGNYYIQNNNYYNPSPTVMECDHSGNLYFIDQYSQSINKVDANGVVSTFVSGYYNPLGLTVDDLGNLYFIDQNNQFINKVDSDGNVSFFFSYNNYYPGSLTSDTSGNLYFIDQNDQSINKVDANGVVSTFVSGYYNPLGLTVDDLGNLYFIDQNNQFINKVDSDGNVSPYVNYDPNINNPNNLISDNSGNLYFLSSDNGYKIMTILNPANSCTTPSVPTVDGVSSICGNTSTNLTASGIGEIRWYDAPSGGTLLAIGNDFTTPVLTTDTTYYVGGYFCEPSAIRTPITVTVLLAPVAGISGSTTGNDYVTLTASGNGTYLWSGGNDTTSAINTFTKTGTYSVTVTNSNGCSNTAYVNVVVNKMGLDKYGQLITNPLSKVDKNGTINSSTYLNKHGKIASSVVVDRKLNYKVYNASASYANNASEFLNYTNSSNIFSSGSYNASLLLNWTSWTSLNSAGILIPNNGERFAVEVIGFFIPEETGTYTFTCEGDDAVDLFINNVNVANHYDAHGTYPLGSHTGTIDLVVGTKYTFRARQQENAGGEGLRVFWRKPSETSGWNIDTSELSSQ